MKKPLNEVMAKATPGPLRPTLCLLNNAPSEWRLLTKVWGDEPIAVVGPEGYPNVECDAALLAHWYNHGPKLLEALRAAKMLLMDPNAEPNDAARVLVVITEAAYAASKVEVPE
jgi:hypothetical protein